MAIEKRFYPEPDPNQGFEKFSNVHFDPNHAIEKFSNAPAAGGRGIKNGFFLSVQPARRGF
jgi:hypothetical protein